MKNLEQKYLKRIEEECFLDYEGNKLEINEWGDGIGEHLDCGENHKNADIILTDLLKELGYKELVSKYDSIKKWYE